jgi:hypothetical protein
MTVAGQVIYQFTFLSTTGRPDYRVDGYEQALGYHTRLATAKKEVLRLLPRDTRTTGFWIVHGDGMSCALWNLGSRMLARLLGKSSHEVHDPKGFVSVVLSTARSDNEPTFDPADVTGATVSPEAAPRDASC